MIAGKRTRSTSAPMTSAAVIAAKVIWKAAKASSGIAWPGVPTGHSECAGQIPAKPALDKTANDRATAVERQAIVPQYPGQDGEAVIPSTWLITDSRFLARTRPP